MKVFHYPKFGLEPEEIDYLIYFEIIPYAEIVEKTLKLQEKACKDPEDIKFLECAISGRADFVVSGDKDLLALKYIKGIRIITPQELKEVLPVAGGDS